MINKLDTTPDARPKQYRFSVIIPLEFNRGQAEECLRRWTTEQTYPHDKFEIVAAACPSSLPAKQLDVFKNMLRPQDRLLLSEHPHDMALCAMAAQQANGEILFFTESHCLPEPDNLAKSDGILSAHPEWSGFSGRSVRITDNCLSVVEADMYEADIAYGMEEHPWRKILDQFFVVRQEPYFDAGEFRPELGHFAEWHLAARMHQKNHRIGYAPQVQLWHYYVGKTKDLTEFSRDFGRGEMIYHAEMTEDPCRGYFDEPTTWASRWRFLPSLARPLSQLSWHARSKAGAQSRSVSELKSRFRLVSGYGLAAIGPQLLVVIAVLRLLISLCILQVATWVVAPKDFLRAWLIELVECSVELERIRYVRNWFARHSNDESRCIEPASTSLVWQPQNAQVFRSIGMHPLEQWNGDYFRWSEPVAMFSIALAPGQCRFVLRWLPVKPIENLIVYVNEQRIEMTVEAGQATGVFDVTSSEPIRFAWTCEPFAPRPDKRLLGIPVASISWTVIAAESGSDIAISQARSITARI